MPKLYKNTEGKVLMSVGNRLIKQPYEFGNGFQNRMGLNNYIQISGLNISSYFTIFEWVEDTNTAIATRSQYFNLRDVNNDNFSCSRWTTYNNIGISKNGDFSEGGGNFIGIGSTNTGTLGLNCRSYTSMISKLNYVRQNNIRFTAQLTSITAQNFNSIWIGAVRKTNGTVPSDFSSANMRHSRFILFNREVNNNEYLYFYNNRLGNELQSTLGVEIDLHNDFAEILDFSLSQNGSDMRVGCRDYSGFNRHGEIMNLPAGTLQQKVDYANANLFVSFIQ